jgi:hypothetical protein
MFSHYLVMLQEVSMLFNFGKIRTIFNEFLYGVPPRFETSKHSLRYLNELSRRRQRKKRRRKYQRCAFQQSLVPIVLRRWTSRSTSLWKASPIVRNHIGMFSIRAFEFNDVACDENKDSQAYSRYVRIVLTTDDELD